MRLSVVIPAHDEEGSIAATVEAVTARLQAEEIPYEIVCVDDASRDRTAEVIARLAEADPNVRYVRSPYRNGFGFAVRAGLDVFEGDAVAIMMADLSDSPDDLVAYYRLLQAGYDCAFGSRFMSGSQVVDYPKLKLTVNRIVNLGIRLLFGHGFNDTTNAFKAYRREVIDTVQPLLSHHFNLTVELPLKAVVRGHSYAITPDHVAQPPVGRVASSSCRRWAAATPTSCSWSSSSTTCRAATTAAPAPRRPRAPPLARRTAGGAGADPCRRPALTRGSAAGGQTRAGRLRPTPRAGIVRSSSRSSRRRASSLSSPRRGRRTTSPTTSRTSRRSSAGTGTGSMLRARGWRSIRHRRTTCCSPASRRRSACRCASRILRSLATQPGFQPYLYQHAIPIDGDDQRALDPFRLIGVLLGAIDCAPTAAAARRVSRDPWTPVVAAAFVAFVPKFIFLSGVVNNDNLSNTLGALGILVALAALGDRAGRDDQGTCGVGGRVGRRPRPAGAEQADRRHDGAGARASRCSTSHAARGPRRSGCSSWSASLRSRCADGGSCRTRSATAIRSRPSDPRSPQGALPAHPQRPTRRRRRSSPTTPRNVFRSFWYISGYNQFVWRSSVPYAVLWLGLRRPGRTGAPARRRSPVQAARCRSSGSRSPAGWSRSGRSASRPPRPRRAWDSSRSRRWASCSHSASSAGACIPPRGSSSRWSPAARVRRDPPRHRRLLSAVSCHGRVPSRA